LKLKRRRNRGKVFDQFPSENRHDQQNHWQDGIGPDPNYLIRAGIRDAVYEELLK